MLLVLDATTGQNAISQVEAFGAAVPLTGLVMTKLDGTAKGGILVALADKFGLPVHYIGVGEQADDLQVFSAQSLRQSTDGGGMSAPAKPAPHTPADADRLCDLGPLILFFATFELYGIYTATGVFMAAVLAALGFGYWRERR